MPRSIVRLPPAIHPPYEVYISGVLQQPGQDYEIEGRTLVFDRELRKDKISGWRWFLGAWGVGTYRQDDSVDVRWTSPDGTPRLSEALEIEPGEQA